VGYIAGLSSAPGGRDETEAAVREIIGRAQAPKTPPAQGAPPPLAGGDSEEGK